MIKPYRLVITLFVFLFISAPVSASVFTVTKTADTNDGKCDTDCSLREALQAAGNFISDNVVLFSPSLAGSTITVSTTPVEIRCSVPAGDSFFVVASHRRYSFPSIVISTDNDMFNALMSAR